MHIKKVGLKQDRGVLRVPYQVFWEPTRIGVVARIEGHETRKYGTGLFSHLKRHHSDYRLPRGVLGTDFEPLPCRRGDARHDSDPDSDDDPPAPAPPHAHFLRY